MAIDPGDLADLAGPQSRSYRTSVDSRGFRDGPSISSKVVAHDVPDYVTGQTGLEGMSEAISKFFRPAMQGLDSVRQAAATYAAHQREIDEQERQRQEKLDAAAGTAAGLRGERVNGNVSISFADSYAAAMAVRDSTGYTNELSVALQKGAAEGKSPDLVFNEFLKNVGNSGNPIYDATMMKSVGEYYDRWSYQNQQDQLRQTSIKSLETQLSALSSKVTDRSLTVEDISTSVTGLRSHFLATGQMDAYENAPKLVMQSIFAGAMRSGNQQTADFLMTLMNSKGSGRGEESFAESFPDVYQTMSGELTDMWTQGQSAEAKTTFATLNREIAEYKTDGKSTDQVLADIHNFFLRAHKGHEQYGGTSDYVSTINGLDTMAKPIIEQLAGVEYLQMWAKGAADGILDQSIVDKYLANFLTNGSVTGPDGQPMSTDPTKNPAGAAAMVSQLGVLDTDTKKTMSQKLTDTSSPNELLKAFNFYKGIANGYRGEQFALSLIEGEAAKDMFLQLSHAQLTDSADPITLIEQIKQSETRVQDVRKNLNQYYGDKDAETKIRDKIESSLADKFDPWGWNGVTIHKDPRIIESLYDRVLQNYSRRVGAGANFDTVIEDTLKAASDRIHVVPNGDGTATAMLLTTPMKGLPFGEEVSLPGDAKNRTYNTVDIYRQDVSALSEAMPGLFSDPDDVSVRPDEATGMYMVMSGDIPAVFGYGQKYTRRVGGTQVKQGPKGQYTVDSATDTSFVIGPNDIRGVTSVLNGIDAFDSGRFVLRVSPDDPRGYRLYYVPGATDKAQSAQQVIDEKASTYTPSNQPSGFKTGSPLLMVR